MTERLNPNVKSEQPPLRFQSGGAVRPGAFYIERGADKELIATLLKGEFCSVLGPRQMGKSSLRVRVAEKLRDQGIRCATIDLQRIGSSPEIRINDWYYSVIEELSRGLGLDCDLQAFWIQQGQHLEDEKSLGRSTLPYSWSSFLQHQVLARTTEPIVIFVDEIDSVLSLKFSTDDFFAVIRSAHESRPEHADYNRLTFCLLGVAAPNELIRDTTRTNFNIGTAISLEDFSWQQTQEFLSGIANAGGDATRLLSSVFDWTEGQPYMTHKLCQEIAKERSSSTETEADTVRHLVEATFLQKGRTGDPNLRYAEDRYDQIASPATKSQMLQLYRRLLTGQHVRIDTESPAQSELKLTGLAAERHNEKGLFLRRRNQIFATVFDHAWVREKEGERLFHESLNKWIEARERGETGEEYLLRGQAMEEGLAWAKQRDDVTAEERDFLLASQDQARKDAVAQAEARSANRLRMLSVALAIATLVALASGGYAAKKALEANSSAARIQEQNALLAESERQLKVINATLKAQTDALKTSQSKLIKINTELVAQEAVANEARKDALDKAAQLENANLAINRAEASAVGNLRSLYLAYGQREFDFYNAPVRASVYFAEGADLKGSEKDADILSGLARTSQFVDSLIPSEKLAGASLSPDGKRLVVFDNAGKMQLRDPKTGQPIVELGEDNVLLENPWSSDSSRLVTMHSQNRLSLWDPQTGKHLADLSPSSDSSGGQVVPVLQPRLFWSTDGRRLLTSNPKGLQLWETSTGAPVSQLPVELDVITNASQVNWTAEGKRLVTVDRQGRVQLWDAQKGEHLVDLPVTVNASPFDTSLVFTGSGNRFLTLSRDGAKLWNALTGEKVCALPIDGAIADARMSNDGQRIVTLAGGKVQLWNGQSGDPVSTLPVGVSRLEVFRGGQSEHLLTLDLEGKVQLWDALNGKLLHNLPLEKGVKRYADDVSMGYSKRFLTFTEDGVKLWDALAMVPPTDVSVDPRDLTSVSWSEDDKWFTIIDKEGNVRLWNAQAGREISVLPIKDGVNSLEQLSWAARRLITRGLQRDAQPGSPAQVHLLELMLQPSTPQEMIAKVRKFAPYRLDNQRLVPKSPEGGNPNQ